MEQGRDPANEVAPTGPSYQLILKGGGITLEREVGEDIALEIVSVVMGGSRAAAPRREARPTQGGSRTAPRGQSLREYFDEVEPQRNVEKILAIASYLDVVGGQDTFTSDDVKREFRSASEPVPGNYSRDFRWAVSAGWIAPAPDEPGQYFVTNTGHDAITAKFSDEVKKATGVQRMARRRRPRKQGDDS